MCTDLEASMPKSIKLTYADSNSGRIFASRRRHPAVLGGEKPEARNWNSGQIGRDILTAPFIRSSSGRRAAKPDSIFCISGFSILSPRLDGRRSPSKDERDYKQNQ